MPRYIVPNIPSFRINYDAGDMAIIALETILKVSGISYPTWWLASISGDAFKFVYDRQAVFEPMRDRVPVDILSIACSSIGLKSGWIIDKPIETVKRIVGASLQQGWALLAPYLTKSYHGISIIVGIDTEKEVFLIQKGKEDQVENNEYLPINIPNKWDGPVPGPIIWADNPIFKIDGKGKKPNKDNVILETFKRAIELFHGDPLPYSEHPGAQEYSIPILKGRFVPQGLQAFKSLRDEISETEIINWSVIWGIDAQCSQLAYDRLNASRFIRYLAEDFRYHSLKDIAGIYHETSVLAIELKRAYWDDRWLKTNRRIFREKVKTTESLVYQVPNFNDEDMKWIRRVLPVQDTLWGPAVIVDGPKRRRHTKNVIERIIFNEKRAIDRLQTYLNKVS